MGLSLLIALLAPANGLGPAKALTPAMEAGAPQYSLDGKSVVFHAGPADKRDVWWMAADGSDRRQLTTHAGDDRDPTFTRDGAIVWSSNRGETGYDLWRMTAAGAEKSQITRLADDAVEPAASRLRYRLFAVIDDACSGPIGERVSLYEKVAFTRRTIRGASSVWFTSMKGTHLEQMSPEGKKCAGPRWSGDGLELAWTCAGIPAHTRANWDPDFASALAALKGGGARCDDVEAKDWRTDDCLQGLPKRYAQHTPEALPGEGIEGRGYSANRIVFLGERADGLVSRARAAGAEWTPLLAGATGPAWSPRGDRLVFVQGGAVQIAPTDWYLQSATNLADFPELYGAGRSAILHAEHFMARPGTEKEFFVGYEKLRYQRRPVYVTADAALQVFHDEFTGLLKSAEGDAMTALTEMSAALAKRFQASGSEALAVYFTVPAVLLAAAAEIEQDEDFIAAPEDALPGPMAQLKAAIPKHTAAVPEALRPAVQAQVDKILAHAGIADVPMPGGGTAKVDYSQFTVRGHYAASSLAGYFLAMNWYSMVPVSFDAAPAVLDSFDDAKIKAAWTQVDALGGAFMGQPVSITPEHLLAVRAAKPKLFAPYDAGAVAQAAKARLGDVDYRGVEGLEGKPPTRFTLFPKRLGLDSTVFKALSYPDLQVSRASPLPEEVFAAFGSTAAEAHARAEGKALGEAYQAALTAQIGKHGQGATLKPTDLYHAWLVLLRTLAVHDDVPTGSWLRFPKRKAWGDRTLLGALAGYTQLKHNAVLYAAQEYGAECDGDAPVMLFTELPELPEPPAFVDPMPTFFGRLAKTAELVHARLNKGKEPTYHQPWEENPEIMNARRFAERLERIAQREVDGKLPTRADRKWLQMVGGVMEAMFLGQKKSDDLRFGQDEGRQTRGVALVTDLFTNAQRGEVLQAGIGRVMDLYVVTPAPVGKVVTQGGIFSWYRFMHPMSDRLTDETWGGMVGKGNIGEMPAWTGSFVEPRP